MSREQVSRFSLTVCVRLSCFWRCSCLQTMPVTCRERRVRFTRLACSSRRSCLQTMAVTHGDRRVRFVRGREYTRDDGGGERAG